MVISVIKPAVAGIVLLLVNTSVFTADSTTEIGVDSSGVIWELEYKVWLLSCVVDGLLEATTEIDVDSLGDIWELEYKVWLLSCVIDERYGLLEAILVVVIEGVTVATL